MSGRLLATALACLLAMGACGGDPDDARPSKTEPRNTATAAREPRASERPATRTPADARPLNLLLITMDTTRADAIGAYGQPLDTSPNIDRLASEGVLFEQAISSSPQTLPSHATLFTGKYPYAHGARSNAGYVLSDQNVTLAEVLEEAGYRTGAEVAAMVLREDTQITQGFDHYRGADSPDVQLKKVRYEKGAIRETELKVRVASDISRRGLEFIRHNHKRKFFLWLHYFDPHAPYSAPGKFNDKISGSPYLAEVASADSQIGVVIDQLERMGLRNKTLVVLTSDHGEGLGEHGELTHSYFVYQSTIRVPLIFWGPEQLIAGTRIQSPVRTADVVPTVLDLLGVTPPEGIVGSSLRPLVGGEKGEISLAAYGESIELSKVFGTSLMRFVLEGRWKYIHKVNPELYDLETDPKELTNLATRKRHVVDRLRTHLEKLLAEAAPGLGDAETPINDETRAQLAAIGYVAEGTSEELRNQLGSLELSGADPSDLIKDVENLGRVEGFLEREEWARALELLLPLRESNPESAHVLVTLARALEGLDRHAEAIQLRRHIVEREPRNLEHRLKLVALLEDRGEERQATDVLLAGLDFGLCDDTFWSTLNRLLRVQGRYTEQCETLKTATSQCPDSVVILNNYAWTLATSPDDGVRNGAVAVEIARSAIAKLETTDPAYIDTLAAAHAEAGNLAEAIRIQSQALRQLESAGSPEAVVSAFRDHLKEFEAGRAIRDPG